MSKVEKTVEGSILFLVKILFPFVFNSLSLLFLWKVWTQESFQKQAKFDRPGERSSWIGPARTVVVDSDWRFDSLCGT